MDANHPTDTPSQTENNVNTAIKNFEQWNFKNAFKLYFPPRNKLCYKRLTLVKRLSVWFDHIMMSFMMLWQFWMRQISSNRKRRRRKIFYPVPLWQSRVSHQVALENPRPVVTLCFGILWSNFLYTQNDIDQNWYWYWIVIMEKKESCHIIDMHSNPRRFEENKAID